MEAKSLKAACLGAALVTAWGVTGAETQAATDVAIGFNLNASTLPGTITHAELAYTLNTSGSGNFGPFTIASGVPVHFSSGLDPSAFDKYVLVGLGDPGHVVVSMSDGSDAFDTPFETVFPGFNEATIATQLANDDPAISSFTSSVLSGPYAKSFDNGADGVYFSNGQLLGNIGVDANAVPEPTGLFLGACILGGTGLTSRRRR